MRRRREIGQLQLNRKRCGLRPETAPATENETVSPLTPARFPNVRSAVLPTDMLAGLNMHVTVEFAVQLSCALPVGEFVPDTPPTLRNN